MPFFDPSVKVIIKKQVAPRNSRQMLNYLIIPLEQISRCGGMREY